MQLAKWIAYAKFLLGLPRFLARTTSAEEAQLITKQRLNNRETNFLNILQKAVFNYPLSPYLKLFHLFGYSYADVKRLINQYGLEKTLEILRDAGIYFSIEEFKGIIPVRRKGIEFKVVPQDFNNLLLETKKHNRSIPCNDNAFRIVSSIGIDGLREIGTPQIILFSQAYKDFYPRPFPILWMPTFLSVPAIGGALMLIRAAMPPIKWFYYNIPARILAEGFSGKVGFKLLVFMIRLFLHNSAYPEYISREELGKVIKYIINTEKQLFFFASSREVIKLCHLTEREKCSLKNVVFYWTGEPLTLRRRSHIQAQGAHILSSYAFREIGHVGFSCPYGSSEVDEYHLSSDIVALIERKRAVSSTLNKNVFLWTGLSAHLPKIMINVESGDYGSIYKKECKCIYGKLGMDTHVSRIRSFEKLISPEIDFFGERLQDLIEDVLPARIGGEDCDYQFVQESENNMPPRLYLYVSPSLGKIDVARISDSIFNYLKHQDDAEKIISSLYIHDNMIGIKRLKPIPTLREKVWPVFVKTRGLSRALKKESQ